MSTGIEQQIIEIADKTGVIQASDLIERGLSREYLSRLARKGILERVSRGLYQLPNASRNGYESLVEVSKKVPHGVVTLLSALSFHELTTENPHKIWMAIDRKGWKPDIKYPPVRFVTMSAEALNDGVEKHTIGGSTVKIFSPAKTIADCFKYRNKIGIDVALSALRDGWRERKFTMDELHQHAKVCRVKNIMRPYLESLI